MNREVLLHISLRHLPSGLHMDGNRKRKKSSGLRGASPTAMVGASKVEVLF